MENLMTVRLETKEGWLEVYQEAILQQVRGKKNF